MRLTITLSDQTYEQLREESFKQKTSISKLIESKVQNKLWVIDKETGSVARL